MATQDQCNLTLAELDRRAEKILPEIASGAVERDRNRTLPTREIRMIAEAGLLCRRVPAAWGGAGGSVVDVIRFVMKLAQADSSIAQALRAHLVIVEGLLLPGREADADRWFPIMLDGTSLALPDGRMIWQRNV